jgi:hypothetical protein
MALARRYDPATATLVLTWDRDTPLDLRSREGRQLVLEALREEPRVEALVIADHHERRYGRRAVAVLNALLSLERLAEQLGARDPCPAFPGESPRRTRARCAACAVHPRALARLGKKASTNLQEFQAELLLLEQGADRVTEAGCGRCASLTQKDLGLLVERFERLCDLVREVA